MTSTQCYTFSAVALSLTTLSYAQSRTSLLIETNAGDIPITLFDDLAPNTVANFLGYVTRGDYDNSFFHRLIPGFVLQGGGFTVADPGQTPFFNNVPTQAPIANEFGVSNTFGTLAMAQFGNDPDSATSQWFINLADNSSNLDNQNGGFTVFGEINDTATLDLILTSSIIDAGGAFSDLPLNTNDPATSDVSDLITINNITILSPPAIPEPSSSILLMISAMTAAAKRRR